MPISREKDKLYPGGSIRSRAWQDIRKWVFLRSGGMCEGSPLYPECRAENGMPHPVTGSKVVLTVAHINHDVSKNSPDDLKHWCQRCHNTHDAKFRRENAKRKNND